MATTDTLLNFPSFDFSLDADDGYIPPSVKATHVSWESLGYGNTAPIAANPEDDVWGSITGIFGKLTDVGASIFSTVSTLDAKKQAAELETAQNIANINRQSKLDDAKTALQLAQLQYAAGVAAKGQAISSPVNWNLLLVGGLVLGGAAILFRRK